MSSFPLIIGATHAIKLTPNNSLIPSTISDTDQLFKFSKLNDSKFTNWKAVATGASKVAIADESTSAEVVRYIDLNYDIENSAGSLWFLGTAQQDRCYYLQTGSGLSKSNSASVFSDQHHSFGFEETSGNAIDRCGLQNPVPREDVTYQVDGVIGKGCRFGPTAASRFHFQEMPYLGGQSNMTLLVIAKSPSDNTWFQWYNITFQKFGGAPYLGFHAADATLYNVNLSNDDYLYLVGAWDGSLEGTNRIKLYIDKVLQTSVLYEVHLSGGETEESEAYKGDIGSAISDPNNFEMDEFRIFKRTLEQNEIDWRHNQYTDSDYWTPTVQPVISSINYLGDNQYEINGSGFKPEETDPAVTMNGSAASIESADDDQVVVSSAIGENLGINFAITNSDTESDTYNFNIKKIEKKDMAIALKM